MSFATRPDRITEEMTTLLGKGVTYSELQEIVAWVGLPESTAAKLVHAQTSTAGAQRKRALSKRFGRHLIGILVAFVLIATLVNIASDMSWPRVLFLVVLFGLVAYGVFALIARIASD